MDKSSSDFEIDRGHYRGIKMFTRLRRDVKKMLSMRKKNMYHMRGQSLKVTVMFQSFGRRRKRLTVERK